MVFFFFFLLIIVLGLFSIGRLSDFNRVSADVRDLWLPSTRFLGDLNNFTSDFRAAEGTNLLAASATDFEANEKELNGLDQSIAEAERATSASIILPWRPSSTHASATGGIATGKLRTGSWHAHLPAESPMQCRLT